MLFNDKLNVPDSQTNVDSFDVDVSAESGVAIVSLDYLHQLQSDSNILRRIMDEVDVGDIAHYTTYSWLEQHRGAKKGCGREVDARIVAMSVAGNSTPFIKTQVLNKRRHSYSNDKYYSALSVVKDDDLERLTNLYNDYTDIFNCPFDNVLSWYNKRRNKKLRID